MGGGRVAVPVTGIGLALATVGLTGVGLTGVGLTGLAGGVAGKVLKYCVKKVFIFTVPRR